MLSLIVFLLIRIKKSESAFQVALRQGSVFENKFCAGMRKR